MKGMIVNANLGKKNQTDKRKKGGNAEALPPYGMIYYGIRRDSRSR